MPEYPMAILSHPALLAFGCAVLLTLSSPAFAQTVPAPPPPPPPAAPATPPPGWTGSFGAGLALTQGNSDTSTVNVAYDVRRDTGSKVLFKSTGLYIRGESEGELTTDRLAFDARVDRKLNDGTSLYGAVQYLSDEFKQIDYLVSPTVGIAQQLVKTDRTEFAVDAGVGMVWEKNPGFEVKTDGALTAGQNFKHKLTETAEITQRTAALWKMDDFDDGLYIFGLGLAANVTAQTQLKAELLDTYKNKPPTADVKKNDVAILLSFVYKY
jgi:putative salt-induced outer membrane protein YdiY